MTTLEMGSCGPGEKEQEQAMTTALAAHRHEAHPVHYRRGQKRAEKGRKSILVSRRQALGRLDDVLHLFCRVYLHKPPNAVR